MSRDDERHAHNLDTAASGVTSAEITVDLTTIPTDPSRRDDKVQEALETSQFPTGAFRLTEPIELGADAVSGSTLGITARVEPTIHGVTKPVGVDLQARLVDATAVVVGQIPVEDRGTVELQLLLTR